MIYRVEINQNRSQLSYTMKKNCYTLPDVCTRMEHTNLS